MALVIGILKADSVLGQFRNAFGDYPDMFRRMIADAASGQVEFRTYDVQQGHYPARIDECDAYIITGSKASVYDDEEWIRRLGDFVVELDRTRTKLIGICYGHQMVAEVLGGKTEPAASGWGVGVKHGRVIGQADFMQPGLSDLALLVSHKDQVTRLPEDAELLVTSDYCPIAAFRIGDHILAFQGHPEFEKGYSRALMEMREDILGEEKFGRGIASLSERTDEQIVARWILNFIDGGTAGVTTHSDAPRGFETARRQAAGILEDRDRTSALLLRATEKAERKRNALRDVWHDLFRLFRLLRAWSAGEYRGVSWQTILLVATAIVYFVMPFDVIPDFIGVFGFLDDATVIGFVLGKIRVELEEFARWEESN